MSLTRLGIGNRMIENVLIVQCSIILAFFFCTLEHSYKVLSYSMACLW